jgi:dTDP-4-amino-4,6-dideoxygalactose transaminase
MNNKKIPFNKPYLTGRELSYISEAHHDGQLAGDGKFTKRCQQWLQDLGGSSRALLTHSCTAALEMAAILCDIKEGDEIIMPSYTFVSTANAFVLRGGVPVFVDIRPDTLNIDELQIEKAITRKTKAIVAVHYAGVACEMDRITEIAKKHNLFVIEDAAQACLSTYKGRQLGSIGDLGCFSFHETKNIISGEGGALLVNNKNMIERAEIIREKGTNRSRYLRGEVDKYTWSDIGSSYLPGEVIAAFLWAQMEEAEYITRKRISIWQGYEYKLKSLDSHFKLPIIPAHCLHNAHMYYVINNSSASRDDILKSLNAAGVNCVFHYVPLHSSPYGKKISNRKNELPVTDYVSSNIIRLPLWLGIDDALQTVVVEKLFNAIGVEDNSNINMLLQDDLPLMHS